MTTIQSEITGINTAKATLAQTLVNKFGVQESGLLDSPGKYKRLEDWVTLIDTTTVHTTNELTFSSDDTKGADTGTTFDGSSAVTVSPKTIGALSLSGGTVNGNISADHFYTSSDIKFKDNIKNISDSIKEFTWKETGEKSYGFIAQELEKTNPELVKTCEKGHKTVDYTAALCLMISKLENRVKELEDKLKKYE